MQVGGGAESASFTMLTIMPWCESIVFYPRRRLRFSSLFPCIDFTSAIKNIALNAQVIPEPSTCILVYLYGLSLVRLRPAVHLMYSVSHPIVHNILLRESPHITIMSMWHVTYGWMHKCINDVLLKLHRYIIANVEDEAITNDYLSKYDLRNSAASWSKSHYYYTSYES